MGQLSWTFVGESGQRYNVGIYHNAKSGHLLVYCNRRILLIDFQVLESKKYSFFIEDELCELDIERKGDRFAYGFEFNKKVDTPLNRLRNRQERRSWWLAFFFFVGVAVMAALVVVGVQFFRQRSLDKHRDELLATNGKVTVAQVRLDSARQQVEYFFVAEGQTISEKIPFAAMTSGQWPVFPLQSGDEFKVTYAEGEASVHRINWMEPTGRQIEKYKNCVLEKHLLLHPGMATELAKCHIQTGYELAGLNGLADFYFQDLSPEQNRQHNQLTYLRLVRDVPWSQRSKEKCWE
jgi:hypothetical protein